MAVVIKDKNNQVHTIFDFKDFRDIIDPEIYDGIEAYVNQRIDKIEREKEELQNISEVDERTIDSLSNCLIGIKNLLDETIISDLEDGTRMDRKKIGKVMKEVINLIEEEV